MAERNITEPVTCSPMSECNDVIFLWVLGLNGACFADSYGVLIGEGGYKSLYMEVCNVKVDWDSINNVCTSQMYRSYPLKNNPFINFMYSYPNGIAFHR